MTAGIILRIFPFRTQNLEMSHSLVEVALSLYARIARKCQLSLHCIPLSAWHKVNRMCRWKYRPILPRIRLLFEEFSSLYLLPFTVRSISGGHRSYSSSNHFHAGMTSTVAPLFNSIVSSSSCVTITIRFKGWKE